MSHLEVIVAAMMIIINNNYTEHDKFNLDMTARTKLFNV